jgi:hypothetical protein
MSRFEDLRRLQLASIELPQRRQDALTRVHAARQQAELASGAVQDSEADELGMVTAMLTEAGVDPKGKPIDPRPVFSNQAARESEVRRRLKDSKRHQDLVRLEQEALDAKAGVERDLVRVQDDEKSVDRQLEAVATALRAETQQALTAALLECTALEAHRSARKDNHG